MLIKNKNEMDSQKGILDIAEKNIDKSCVWGNFVQSAKVKHREGVVKRHGWQNEDPIFLKRVPEATNRENDKEEKSGEIMTQNFLELILKYMDPHISRIQGLQGVTNR